MKQFLLNMITEKSRISSMRVAFMITTLTACILSIYIVLVRNITWEEVTLVTTLLGVAQTGKVTQKTKEITPKGEIDETCGNGKESD